MTNAPGTPAPSPNRMSTGIIPSIPVSGAAAAITKNTICHIPMAFFRSSGGDPVMHHARPPTDFYHCYSRHFVDNLRQRPRRRGFPGPLTGPLQRTVGDSKHAAVHTLAIHALHD